MSNMSDDPELLHFMRWLIQIRQKGFSGKMEVSFRDGHIKPDACKIVIDAEKLLTMMAKTG